LPLSDIADFYIYRCIGCNEPDVPLLLYVADYPYSSFNNISFISSGFSPRQQQILFGNALTTISQNNNNLTANWTTCVACGAILRSLQRLDITVPDACQTCFEQHCWQGNTVDAQPSFPDPGSLLTNDSMTFEIWNQTVFFAENDLLNVSDSKSQNSTESGAAKTPVTTWVASIVVSIFPLLYLMMGSS